MIVAYDARPLQPQTRHCGVGVVVDNLLARLSGRFQFSGIAHPFPGAEEEGITTWPRIPYMNPLTFEGSVLFLNEFDIYWGTNDFLPALAKCPSVITVHDLLLLKYPSDQSLTPFLASRFVSSLKRANRIIADSQTTADDLIALFPNIHKKVVVGLLGFDSPEDMSINACCPDGMVQDSPYVVMLGALRPRKNLPLAIAAVSQVRERGSKLRLVVTGDVHLSFEKLVSESREFVSCTGVLPKPRLFNLLKGAVGLMFPSFYEGFGFPVLEAMAAGCPVLALDTPINREIAGDAAQFLPPEPSSWSETLANLVNTTSMRGEMRERGIKNLRRFSWDKTAALYADMFSELGANGRS
jgi:glycosyltransferase involved in cell wall biosynthesis